LKHVVHPVHNLVKDEDDLFGVSGRYSGLDLGLFDLFINHGKALKRALDSWLRAAERN